MASLIDVSNTGSSHTIREYQETANLIDVSYIGPRNSRSIEGHQETAIPASNTGPSCSIGEHQETASLIDVSNTGPQTSRLIGEHLEMASLIDGRNTGLQASRSIGEHLEMASLIDVSNTEPPTNHSIGEHHEMASLIDVGNMEPNHSIGEHQEEASLIHETGRMRELAAEPCVKKLDERLSAYFKKATTMINVLLPLTVLAKLMRQERTMPWLVVAFFALAGISFLVNFLGMRWAGGIQSESELTGAKCRYVETLCTVVYISVILSMFTTSAALLFIDMMLGWTAIALFPVFLLLALLFRRKYEGKYASEEEKRHDFQPLGHIGGAAIYFTKYELELKLYLDFSMEVVAAAFTGLLGTVLGYMKASPNQEVGIRAAECLLFYGILLGLLVTLLSLVPPATEQEDTQSAVVKLYIRALAYAMLLFVILAGIAAAVEILQGFVVLAIAPNVLVAVACLFKKHKEYAHVLLHEKPAAASREAAAKRSLILFVVYSPLFLVLMASCSTYAGRGTALSLPFKCFVSAALCAVVTFLSRIVLVLEDPDKQSFALARRVSTGAMYAATATAVVCGNVAAMRNPEELKKIL